MFDRYVSIQVRKKKRSVMKLDRNIQVTSKTPILRVVWL